jgi:hypothetical protein
MLRHGILKNLTVKPPNRTSQKQQQRVTSSTRCFRSGEIAAYFCATHDPCQFDPLRPTPRPE